MNELLFSAVGSRTMCFAVSCTERVADRWYYRHKPGRRPYSPPGNFGRQASYGEHRIIDGYHSSYILARFKGGLFNGDYEEYIYNKLKAKSSYKEGGRTEPAESMTLKVG